MHAPLKVNTNCIQMALSKPQSMDLVPKSGKKAKKRNFVADIDDEYLKKIHLEQQNKHTKWAEAQAEVSFTDYLKTLDLEDFQFWDFEVEFLDDILSKYWFAVRQSELDAEGNPKKYKVSSLKSLRYALN